VARSSGGPADADGETHNTGTPSTRPGIVEIELLLQLVMEQPVWHGSATVGFAFSQISGRCGGGLVKLGIAPADPVQCGLAAI